MNCFAKIIGTFTYLFPRVLTAIIVITLSTAVVVAILLVLGVSEAYRRIDQCTDPTSGDYILDPEERRHFCGGHGL